MCFILSVWKLLSDITILEISPLREKKSRIPLGLVLLAVSLHTFRTKFYKDIKNDNLEIILSSIAMFSEASFGFVTNKSWFLFFHNSLCGMDKAVK